MCTVLREIGDFRQDASCLGGCVVLGRRRALGSAQWRIYGCSSMKKKAVGKAYVSIAPNNE
jgi:hypothetical protein